MLAVTVLFAGMTPGSAADLARSVGRIVSGDDDEGHCSAVFFAPDRALTAGHCLGGGSAWRRTSVAGLHVLLDGARLSVGSVTLSPRSPFDAAGKIADLRNDWAVLTLAGAPPGLIEPLSFVGAAGARAALLTGDTVLKAGFQGRELRDSGACRISDLEPSARSFTFRCGEGMGHGLSGSALLMRRDAGFALLGVQSARAGNGPAVMGIAVVPPEAALLP